MDPIFIPALILIPLMVAGCIWAYRHEKFLWNNGICAQYNEPWVHFDNDSQSGRGYKCRDATIWISWPVDRLRAIPVRSNYPR
jgi:hypothetical protein